MQSQRVSLIQSFLFNNKYTNATLDHLSVSMFAPLGGLNPHYAALNDSQPPLH